MPYRDMHPDQRDFRQRSQSRVAISEQASDRAESRGAGLMLMRLTNLSDLDYQHTSNTPFPKFAKVYALPETNIAP